MSSLDPETVRVVSTIGAAGPAAVFAAATAQRHNDPPGRIWSVGFLTLVACLAVTAVLDGDLRSTLLEAIVAAGIVLAVAAMWMGLRLIGGRTSAGWAVTGGGAVGVALACWLVPDAARATQLAVVAVFAALGVVELWTGPTRAYIESWLLRVVLGVLTVLAAGAVVRSIANPPEDGGPSDWRVLSLGTVLLVTAMVAISALREGEVSRLAGGRTRVSRLRGVLPVDELAERADDVLDRAALTGEVAALALVRLTDVDSIGTAYGQRARGLSVQHVADVLRRHLPADATVGYVGRGGFAVVLTRSVSDPPPDVEKIVRTGLAVTPPSEGVPLRVHCEVTVIDPADRDDLLAVLPDTVARTLRSEPSEAEPAELSEN